MTRGRRSAPPQTVGKRRRSDPLRAVGLPTKRGRTPPAGSIASIAAKLGNNGVLLLLLETPSGFAILSFDGVQLFLPGAIENMWANFGADFMAEYIVWLKEFKVFMDKSNAIRFDTGVDRKLSNLILKWRRPGQMLIVGKPEYKTIIETSMGIPCLFNETVMEVMWGLKNIMHSLVRKEKVKLTKEDRLPMSQGLKRFLNCQGFDVAPEMVNERIVLSACALYDCDLIEKKHYASLKRACDHLKDVSGINAQDWSLLKLATALMIICYPEKEPLVGEEVILTDDERLRLRTDAQKYNDKFIKCRCLRVYHEIVGAHEANTTHRILLAFLVKEAKEAYEARLAEINRPGVGTSV